MMVCLDICSYIFFLVCFTWSFCLCLNLLFEYVVYVYPQILEILNYFLKYLFDSKNYHLLLFISFTFGNLLEIESDLLVGPKYPRFNLLFCLSPFSVLLSEVVLVMAIFSLPFLLFFRLKQFLI